MDDSDTPVDAENYDVIKGSVIIRFHVDFLETLPEGRHKLKFVFKKGDEVEPAILVGGLKVKAVTVVTEEPEVSTDSNKTEPAAATTETEKQGASEGTVEKTGAETSAAENKTTPSKTATKQDVSKTGESSGNAAYALLLVAMAVMLAARIVLA